MPTRAKATQVGLIVVLMISHFFKEPSLTAPCQALPTIPEILQDATNQKVLPLLTHPQTGPRNLSPR